MAPIAGRPGPLTGAEVITAGLPRAVASAGAVGAAGGQTADARRRLPSCIARPDAALKSRLSGIVASDVERLILAKARPIRWPAGRLPPSEMDIRRGKTRAEATSRRTTAIGDLVLAAVGLRNGDRDGTPLDAVDRLGRNIRRTVVAEAARRLVAIGARNDEDMAGLLAPATCILLLVSARHVS